MLNDTLYDALQGFEMKLAMQYNRCMELPCRQIVRTSMTVASVMLQDDNVEQNRDTYLRLINRLMDGSQQERMMVLIVTIALFGLLDTPQARRCRNTLRNDECEAFDEYLSLYEQFLASNDTCFSAEDFELDTNNLLYNPQPLIIMKENTQPQTVINMSAGATYIAEQHIDIHDNQQVYLGYDGAPQTNEPTAPIATEPTQTLTSESVIFTKKAKQEGNIPSIIQALQHSMKGRNDKARAFVEELQSWQDEEYIDAHYNARVMYDEMDKILNLPFQYGGFRKYYNE